MNLIDKDIALYQLGVRKEMSGGIAMTTFQRAIEIVDKVPVVEVEKKEEPAWKTGTPRKKGQYLVSIECPKGSWIEIGNYEGKGTWTNFTGEEDSTAYVTHWMKLPQKP